MILPRTALAEWRTVGIANPLGVGISRVQAYFKAAISTTIGISLLTTYRIRYKIRFALLIEGRVLETIPECGARCGCPATALAMQAREAHGTARRALRPGCEELAARAAEDNAADGSAAGRHKSPRWSAERRASYVISAFTRVLRRTMGRKAPRKRLARRVMCGPQRMPLHPCACRRSAHPSEVGASFTTRAPSRRGNEYSCLTSEEMNDATPGVAARRAACACALSRKGRGRRRHRRPPSYFSHWPSRNTKPVSTSTAFPSIS